MLVEAQEWRDHVSCGCTYHCRSITPPLTVYGCKVRVGDHPGRKTTSSQGFVDSLLDRGMSAEYATLKSV